MILMKEIMMNKKIIFKQILQIWMILLGKLEVLHVFFLYAFQKKAHQLNIEEKKLIINKLV